MMMMMTFITRGGEGPNSPTPHYFGPLHLGPLFTRVHGFLPNSAPAKTLPLPLMSSGGLFTVPADMQEAPVHSIPCKTAYSGPARVRTFFQPVVDVEQQRLQAEHSSATAFGVPHISAFRGRTLRGAEIALPESFSGTRAFRAPSIFRRRDYARHSHCLRAQNAHVFRRKNLSSALPVQ